MKPTGDTETTAGSLKAKVFRAARAKFGEEGATWVGKYIRGADDRRMQEMLRLIEEAGITYPEEDMIGIDELRGNFYLAFEVMKK